MLLLECQISLICLQEQQTLFIISSKLNNILEDLLVVCFFPLFSSFGIWVSPSRALMAPAHHTTAVRLMTWKGRALAMMHVTDEPLCRAAQEKGKCLQKDKGSNHTVHADYSHIPNMSIFKLSLK